MNYTYIDREQRLIEYLNSLKDRGIREIALDFEGEFNLHRYGEKLCLVQIYDGEELVIIDPFKVRSKTLCQLFENRRILKLMYDASGDQALLQNTHKRQIKTILDLRPAVMLLAFAKQDLASVLKTKLGVESGKKSKFQKYNWVARPIEEEALNYALEDVLYLFELKDALLADIWHGNLMEEYILHNANVQNKSFKRAHNGGMRRIKGVSSLCKEERERFKQFFELRDSIARKIDRPPNYVLDNASLIKLSKGNITVDEIQFPRRMNSNKKEYIQNRLKHVTENMN